MAKHAKQVSSKELPDTVVNKAIRDVLDHYEEIESARGKFMNIARRQREGMVAIYEGMASRGVSQKAMKTEIKIIRLIERLKGFMADLEAEDRKMVQRLAKARGDKKQLSLLLDVPQIKTQDDNVVTLRTDEEIAPASA